MCLFLERRPEGTYSKFSATPTRADIHGVLLIKLKATMHSNVHSNVHTGLIFKLKFNYSYLLANILKFSLATRLASNQFYTS